VRQRQRAENGELQKECKEGYEGKTTQSRKICSQETSTGPQTRREGMHYGEEEVAKEDAVEQLAYAL
jgi:hypothetical protein